MKTSNIKTVSQPKEWKSEKGTFYFFDIHLENGDTGNIGSKESNPSFLQVGQELTYEITSTERGNKIKRVQEKKQGYKADTLGIAIGQGLNLAVQSWTSGKIEKEKIKDFAKWIAKTSYELRDELSHLK